MSLVLEALWLIFPAYAANACAVLAKGRRPLDRGAYAGKYRLLGDGKTVEGTMVGIAAGIAAGLVQMQLQGRGIGPGTLSIPLVVLLSTGAIAGDIAGAFIKRRLGMPRGRSAFPLDQLDFIAGALVFSSFVHQHDARIVLLLAMLTPPIHYATNILGYLLRFKRTPW